MSKVIKAVFTGRFCTTRRVFQYDTDDKLQIVNLDLPQNYTVDFSNSLTGQSVPVLATSDTVQIPPEMFVPGSEIYAWVWISDTNGGYTKCQATIPIDPRAQRTGTEPTPAEASAWDEAVDTLNETVEGIPTAIDTALAEAKASGEFDGPKGDPGPRGTGFWSTTETPRQSGSAWIFISLWTAENSPIVGDVVLRSTGDVYHVEEQSGSFTITTYVGSIKGDPGDDGISPVASVSKSGSTATITITDKNGTTTASITDGQDGTPGTKIWYTKSAVSESAGVIKTQRNKMTGQTGTPAAEDFLFGPAVYAGSGDATDLYIITASSTLCTLTWVGKVKGASGDPGATGTTFTPVVSSAGVISWTNDGGKQNPPSVDIVSAVLDALPTWEGGNF